MRIPQLYAHEINFESSLYSESNTKTDDNRLYHLLKLIAELHSLNVNISLCLLIL